MKLLSYINKLIEIIESLNDLDGSEEIKEVQKVKSSKYEDCFAYIVLEVIKMKMQGLALISGTDLELTLSILNGRTIMTKEKIDTINQNIYPVLKLASYLKQINSSDYSTFMYVLAN